MAGSMTQTEEVEWRWSVGLPGFLAHSNEDEHNIGFVSGLITFQQDAHVHRPERLKIVDIGCGSASKSLSIVRRLSVAGISVELDLIDNDVVWLPIVERSLEHRSGLPVRTLIPCDANDWLEQQGAPAPDWAMMLHVAYSARAEQLARRVCATLIPKGSIVIISGECQNSDLAQLRQYIMQRTGIPMPTPRISGLASWLDTQPWRVWRNTLGDKWLGVPSDDYLGRDRWFIELIAGRALSDFRVDERSQLLSAISQGLHRFSHGHRMLIPDDTIIAWHSHD
jgi:hypothetical protein